MKKYPRSSATIWIIDNDQCVEISIHQIFLTACLAEASYCCITHMALCNHVLWQTLAKDPTYSDSISSSKEHHVRFCSSVVCIVGKGMRFISTPFDFVQQCLNWKSHCSTIGVTVNLRTASWTTSLTRPKMRISLSELVTVTFGVGAVALLRW